MWAEKSAWSCVWTSDLNCAGCSVCVNVCKNPNAKNITKYIVNGDLPENGIKNDTKKGN